MAAKEAVGKLHLLLTRQLLLLIHIINFQQFLAKIWLLQPFLLVNYYFLVATLTYIMPTVQQEWLDHKALADGAEGFLVGDGRVDVGAAGVLIQKR